MPPSILGQIDRVTQCWKRGEECLALIHLALAGLHRVEDRRETARRLFMADGLMKAGVQPHSILQALDLAPAEEPFHRFLDSEARVPAGSGGVSGEWTKTASVLAGLTEAAAEFLLNAAKLGLSENPYSLAFGLIPRGSDLRTSGDVPEIPGLLYAWNRDETTLNLTYDGEHGQRRIDAMLGMDGTFRDGDRVVARLLSDGTLVVDPAEVSSDLAHKDGPNLCPKTQPDRPGSREKDKHYEDQIKLLVNPDNPTPRGYGYAFYNPETRKQVFIDDCQHATGNPVEVKSEYDQFLPWNKDDVEKDWLDQSGRQLAATKGRELFWVFAQQKSADFAAKIFGKAEDGQKQIHIIHIPRAGAVQ